MNTSDKKILNINLKNDFFVQIKNGEKKTELVEYKKHWKEKLIYPCGTFKKYDFVLFQCDISQILVELKGIKIVKAKKGWFKMEKHFEIELGNVVGE